MKDLGAIILAAGGSARMGRCKPLLPLGGRTVLEHVMALFHNVGIPRICVVTGFHRERILPYLHVPGVLEARNPHPEKGMFSSLCTGIAALAPLCSAMFLLPVDIPLVRTCTLQLLATARQKNPAAVIMPYCNGKSGHPPLLPSSLAPSILDWTGAMGLHGFFRSVAPPMVPVEVPDEHMLLDMDTPRAYEEITTAWSRFDIPSRMECLVLLEHVCHLPEHIRRHSIMVAHLARAMGEHLLAAGQTMDPDLLEAAGLLHDVARLQPHHGPRGAKLLADMGFARVGRIIEPHSDMDVPPQAPMTPQEIIFLADKYFKGDTPVSLAERYGAKMEQYGTSPKAREHIRKRLAHARQSEARFEGQTGVVLEELARLVAGKRQESGED
jgi:CTP:molybdopterin cytidylyltransferase MocA